MGTDNIIFHCHYMPSPCEDGVSLRVTIKPKALFKPFGKTVIEPFLKAVNAKLPEAERVGVEDFERFMVGPGTRMSDTVSDLSVTVQSVLPTDTEDQDEDQAGIVRVDLMPRTTRDVTLIYRHIGFEASLPAQHVHVTLANAVLKGFCKHVNSYDPSGQTQLTVDDVLKVTGLSDEELDFHRPASEVLPRAGNTKLTVVLKPEGAVKANAVLPPPPPKDGEPQEPPGQVFRVRCGDVELKLTLPHKAFGKSLRDAILTPFLGAYAKRHPERSPRARAGYIVKVVVEGMAVSDAVLASSFASGNALVRIQVHLEPPPPPDKPTAEVDEDEDDEVVCSDQPGDKVSSHSDLNRYYGKWDKFADIDQ